MMAKAASSFLRSLNRGAPETTDRSSIRWVSEEDGDPFPVEIPVAEFWGGDGLTVAVTAGMHAGEYDGVLAAIELIKKLRPMRLTGRVIVIPVVSVAAFFDRSMQLSPVDEREVHYIMPGSRERGYSARLIDRLMSLVGSADAVVDLHGGEFVQDLTPYVCVPRLQNRSLWDDCLRIATCFQVPFVACRDLEETPLGLPRALLEAGVPNVWTEIGCNGLARVTETQRQYQGALNVVRHYGVIDEEPEYAAPRIVGPQHWSVFAEESGLWIGDIRAGQSVRKGQRLGRLTDVFGTLVREYLAPADAIVQYVCTSPAINADRTPDGYRWHQQVVQLAQDAGGPNEEPRVSPSE